jgi:hypothetical protein
MTASGTVGHRMSPLPGLGNSLHLPFSHGWRHGLNDAARYAGFQTPPCSAEEPFNAITPHCHIVDVI